MVKKKKYVNIRLQIGLSKDWYRGMKTNFRFHTEKKKIMILPFQTPVVY